MSLKKLSTSRQSSTSNVNPVYLSETKKVALSPRVYNLDSPGQKFDLYVNDVKINLGANVRDVRVTEQGINIIFKN